MPLTNIDDLFGVKALVVVITGGGSGLGLYAARALERNGAIVYIVGRREASLQAAAKTAAHGNIKYIVGDATSKESLTKVADRVRKEQGYVNLLFANAGVSGPAHSKALKKDDNSKPTVKEFQEAMFKPEMDDFTLPSHVNATGVFYTAMAFLDLLDAGNKKGNVPQDSQIIVTSSIAGFSRQLAHGYAYSASKAAATHLVKMLSTSFAQNQYHIRVNLIAPGLYPSEMTEGVTSNMEKFPGHDSHPGVFEGALRMPAERSPAERTGSEEDIAGTILYMASRAGAYLNGETLVTDGGRLAQMPSVY